jgi:hypothetical protein
VAGPPPVFMGTVSFIDPADSVGYVPVSGGSTAVANRSDAEIALPRAGTMTGLSVGLTARQGTTTLTLWVNGVATALACTVPAQGSTCSDTGESIAVAAGDVVSFKYAADGTPPIKNLRYAVGFEGN